MRPPADRSTGSTLGHVRSWLWTIPAAVFVTSVLITLGVIALIVAPGDENQRRIYTRWAGLVFKIIGARVTVLGLDDLDLTANYVFAANHASLMDIPAMFYSVPVPFKFLAKKELLKVPFIGWYIRRGGHLAVDRQSVRSSIASTNECARLMRERHLSVAIFPEGTRSPDGNLQPFRDGAAFLAIQAGVPVVPMAIVGMSDVLPARTSWFTPGDVQIRFGAPIPVEGLTTRQRADLTTRLETAVRELSGRDAV